MREVSRSFNQFLSEIDEPSLADALLVQSFVSTWDEDLDTNSNFFGPLQGNNQHWKDALIQRDLPTFTAAMAENILTAIEICDERSLRAFVRLTQEGLRWAKIRFGTDRPKHSAKHGFAWEAWGGYPQTFFTIRHENRVFVGKKLLSNDFLNSRIKTLFDASIHREDLLGELLSFRCTDQRIEIYFRPIAVNEFNHIFQCFKLSKDLRIDFPFCALDHRGLEMTTAGEGWEYSSEHEAELEWGERPFMRHSIELMRELGIYEGHVFDPACSTGVYLASLKAAFPKLRLFGQDLSKEMLRVAETRLDQVFLGDSREPKLAPGSVDLLILRFLNSEVVRSSEAEDLLNALLPLLKPHGYVFVFGFSPILVAIENFERRGLKLMASHFFDESREAIYPFIVLRRGA